MNTTPHQLNRELAGRAEETPSGTAAVGPHITVWAAANADGVWALCGDEGQLIGYGPFSFDDPDHPRGSHERADHAAAVKAIHLAHSVREALGAPAATLHLTVSHPLDLAVLNPLATRHRLWLDLTISDDWNPATEWCDSAGYRQPELDPADLIDQPYPTAS
jgi:hypothetical protein